MEKITLGTRKVSIEFPGVKALSDVDFEIGTGVIHAVMGANGAGKSTLMKVLAGSNPDYTGEVLYNGNVVELRNTAAAKKAVDASISCSYEAGLLKKLARLEDQIAVKADELDDAVMKLKDAGDIESESYMIRDVVLSKMGELRVACDEAETMTAKKYWPFPTYGDLLFGVK